ncbi:GNAT family N-acetyltransferase [Kribbella capetownensis]|uniref:GNAT family N-acetyltransferase n=1 Tax=Kribbella capetownensis TaxID=1572659 RepID=A0A4R0JUS9_9ACTN|nr:GNAT family N-acetyltransferase [Kribbella capetownensis]TCC51203.1 GNAT family N-acetyltransferase [Kribbella capetownensis]
MTPPMLTLVRPPGPLQAAPVEGVVLRPPVVADTAALGRLYFEAYPPGAASASEQEAIEDIALTFEDAYGVLDSRLSRLALVGDRMVGAILVVQRAPWPDTPDCAFVIELFTAPTHRRLGIARLLLSGCSAETVALRVDDDNTPALTLYRTLGFQDG